jgi:1-phosphofructokinase family hexose kinase
MILCVTLNPVLDTTFFVDEMRPIYRTEARRVTFVAGGKGDNVARALGVLAEPAHALVALGGDTGRHVANLLAAEGIAATPAWVSGETRLQITVIDRALVQRAFYAPAASFTAADRAEFRRRFEDLLPGADAVCISGSAPDVMAAGLVPELLALARDRGLPTLLDSSGEGLRRGVTAAPRIIKVNLAEAEALLGRRLVTPEDQVAALDPLRGWGSDWAVLTLGERGALFSAGDRRWSAAPPKVAAINPIGCGDAMTAGLMAGLVRGLPPEECFRVGMAAAAANTLTWDACRYDAGALEALLPQVELVPLRPEHCGHIPATRDCSIGP